MNPASLSLVFSEFHRQRRPHCKPQAFISSAGLSAALLLGSERGGRYLCLSCGLSESSAEKHRATLQLSLPQVCTGEVAAESFDQASTGSSPSPGNAASTKQISSMHPTETLPVLRHLSGLHPSVSPLGTVHLHGPRRNALGGRAEQIGSQRLHRAACQVCCPQRCIRQFGPLKACFDQLGAVEICTAPLAYIGF